MITLGASQDGARQPPEGYRGGRGGSVGPRAPSGSLAHGSQRGTAGSLSEAPAAPLRRLVRKRIAAEAPEKLLRYPPGSLRATAWLAPGPKKSSRINENGFYLNRDRWRHPGREHAQFLRLFQEIILLRLALFPEASVLRLQVAVIVLV